MDPVTLSAGAVALLSPLVARASGEFAGEAGAAAWRLAERMLKLFRSAASDDPLATASLDEFAEAPERAAPAAQATLHDLLLKDPTLATEVEALLSQVKSLGPTVAVTQRIREAEDVVGLKASKLNRGEVDVVQEFDKATRVVGVELGDIG